MLAVSVDGRLAPAQGGPAQLGGQGDRRVLEEALAWADGVLVGAQTLRMHRSSCLIHAPDLLRARHAWGRPPQPPVVVWSRRGAIPDDLPFFQQPFERWLLVGSPPSSQPAPVSGAFSRILPFEGWPQTLQRLGALGLRQIAVLGGGQLAADLMTAGALDELQLTICPQLLGGEHLWLPALVHCDPSMGWQLLEHRQLQGGELLLRYGREARP